MPLSGGVKTRVNDFTNNEAANIDPTASQFDNEFDDTDAALNLALYRDGQAAATANLPMGGFVHSGMGVASADTHSMSRAASDARYRKLAEVASGIPLNASITASVGSSELTVALKDAAGSDPSAASPVVLGFRSATAGTGSITLRSVTAATSIVMNSTATIGTSNGVAFSLWVVAFDDGGTIRLGVINCLSSLDIFKLEQQGIASSTDEDNAADNAHVFYTSTAVTSKPYIVLGRLVWNSGLVTAGTWNAAPDVIVNYGPGVKLPGDVVQRVISRDGALATGATTLPFDDTIPQNTEGNQYMSKDVTPTVAANVLRMRHQGAYASSSVASGMTVAVFQDSTAGALMAVTVARNAAGAATTVAFVQHDMLAATTSATTLKIRAGVSSAGTTTFNGSAGARLYGGVNTSFLEIEELVA